MAYRCSMFTWCDYETVRQEDAWRKPPGFWGPWSAPPPEHVVERRVEAVTFAEARAYFTDCEAGLMPDFERPVWPRSLRSRDRTGDAPGP